MQKFSLRFYVLIAAALLLSACGPQATPPAVEAATAQPEMLIAEGRLQPISALDQSFSLPGQVAEVLVRDGEMVQAGQVLARLTDSPEAQLALARAEQEALVAQQALDDLMNNADVTLAQQRLELIRAQEEWDAAQETLGADDSFTNQAAADAAAALARQAEQRLANLESGEGVDPAQKDAAQARLVSASAAAGSAQAALDALELKASATGTVVDADLQPGQRVTAGQPVLTLADFSSWVVQTDNLTEVDVVALKVGQQVQVILDALPGKPLTGEITHINARFEEKRGDITYTVTIKLNQTDPSMRWGMTAAVQFVP
jgi:multidrug resistance efflux pump